MCTWAYAWVSSKGDGYIPLLFLAAIIADASMVVSVANEKHGRDSTFNPSPLSEGQ